MPYSALIGLMQYIAVPPGWGMVVFLQLPPLSFGRFADERVSWVRLVVCECAVMIHFLPTLMGSLILLGDNCRERFLVHFRPRC